MNTTMFSARFHSAAGIAHGSVSFCKATPDSPRGCLRATLAFECIGNRELLATPSYDAIFSVDEPKRAKRCLKAAARYRGLKVMPDDNLLSQRFAVAVASNPS